MPLRDSWAAGGPEAGPRPRAKPRRAQGAEGAEGGRRPPEPLSAEELEQLERLRPEMLPVIDDVLAAHPTEVESYRNGKTGLLGFLIAQVMKQVGQGAARPTPSWSVCC